MGFQLGALETTTRVLSTNVGDRRLSLACRPIDDGFGSHFGSHFGRPEYQGFLVCHEALLGEITAFREL
jgi:hypothetical protein